MSKQNSFCEIIDLIVKEDSRFDKEVYHFVRNALDYTIKELNQNGTEADSNKRHVSGKQLLTGIRAYALEQYGPMSKVLLEHWGVKKCSHFGNIVFNLVKYEILGKTSKDSEEDFHEGYDFWEAFVKPFLPERKQNANSRKSKKTSKVRKTNGLENLE
jgi:uncharacterized repeat protein (TIGR04138 family)